MNATRIVLLIAIVGLVGASGYLAYQKMRPGSATAENTEKNGKPAEPTAAKSNAEKPVAENAPATAEVADGNPPTNDEPGEDGNTLAMPAHRHNEMAEGEEQPTPVLPASRLPGRVPPRGGQDIARTGAEGDNPFDTQSEPEEASARSIPRMPTSPQVPESRIPARNASARAERVPVMPAVEEPTDEVPLGGEEPGSAEIADWATESNEPPEMTAEPEAEVVERVPTRRGLPTMVQRAPAEEVEGYTEETVTRVEFPAPKKSAAAGKGPIKKVAAPVQLEETEAAEVDPDEAAMNDGFDAVEVEKGRAVGKTEVRKPARGKPERIANAGESSGISLEDEIEAVPEPITPRHTPTSASKARTPVAIEEPVGEMPSGEVPSRSEVAPRGDTYVVQPNDNFWKISRKVYGSARYFQALTHHNASRATDPHNLRPGMEVSTPPKDALQARYPELIDLHPAELTAATRPVTSRRAAAARGEEPSTTSSEGTGLFTGPNGEPMYRVGPDDTLGSISQKHLGRASRWNEIAELNQEVLANPNALRQGVELKLPSDASRVRMVSE